MKQANKKVAPTPRRLRVGKRWYSVEIVEAMANKHEIGRVHYNTRTIELARKTKDETFWHELTHAILHDLGEHRLNARESFVEEFSARLAAAVKTARFW
jgi:hypothetical protein